MQDKDRMHLVLLGLIVAVNLAGISIYGSSLHAIEADIRSLQDNHVRIMRWQETLPKRITLNLVQTRTSTT